MSENIWILTEERPKKDVIEKIINKTKTIKKLDIEIENFKIKPIFNGKIFTHTFQVDLIKSKSIKNIFIKLISSGKQSSFVDFLIFLQKDEPIKEQILENCVYAIEETKTNTYDSRNTAMGQRSSKFNTLNYYIQKYKYKLKPVMYFSHKQAESDHDSVQFINRCLCHLESGIEFWGKDSSKFKKFSSLDELIKLKNKIAGTNTRNKDTPIKITKEKDLIKISGLLANPGADTAKHKYTGTIKHDPNIGQLPLIAKAIRTLDWKEKIIITDHRILPEKVVEGRGNKFTRLAKYIDFELENCPFPETDFHLDYWKYEKYNEKVSTILAQIILENKEMETIFDNHGGCEKSYFYGINNAEIKISKQFSNDGGKIPDLVVKDNLNKIIYLYEGKTAKNIKAGLEEIEAFALFETMYLKVNYPNFKYKRGLIINGGNKIDKDEVKFQLCEDSKIIQKDEFN
jgi:hypothetical protein